MTNIIILSLIIITLCANIILLIWPYKSANFLKILDDPSKLNKIHKIPIPKLGGVLIFTFFTLSYLINYYLNPDLDFILFKFNVFIFIFFYFLIGYFDDLYDLSALFRVIFFLTITTFYLILDEETVLTKIYFEYFDTAINFGSLGFIFTLFCFIFLQNSLNMIDGINGLLLIISISIFTIITIINFKIFFIFFILYLLILIIYNLKNYLFLGNNGSSILSAIIGFTLIKTHIIFPIEFSAEKIFLLMLLPSIEVLRLFFLRIKNSKSPFAGDLNHFHHVVLLKIDSFYWLISIFLINNINYFLSFYINTYIIIFINIAIYLYLLKKMKNYDIIKKY
tara:strand:- start:523 stop:1533 length:1011 start_codon:yes stop_codon:yes gene_type:complete